jgi:hypothetical protein
MQRCWPVLLKIASVIYKRLPKEEKEQKKIPGDDGPDYATV